MIERLNEMFARLLRGEGDAESLAAFRRELLSSDAPAAIAAIRSFLESGKNHSTGGRLSIAPGGGGLEAAPTFRVWLIDLLGVLDRASGTAEGAAISRGILAVKTSADEWALALRNVAWAEPAAREFLAAKFRELIAHQPWRAQASAGLLEAFDTAVFLRDPTLVPLLDDLMRGEQRALHRAAAMALDRLAEADPLAVMTYLNDHPTACAERPLLRADYFAKADLGAPPQRAALETYLSRPDVALPEKTKLIQALAAPASFVGDTLLTAAAAPPDDAARAAAVERAVGDWIAARRFPTLEPALVELQERLRER